MIEAVAKKTSTFEYGKKCLYCGDFHRMSDASHQKHEEACKLEWEAKQDSTPTPAFPDLEKSISEKFAGDLSLLPSIQKYIKTIDKCKRVLGRNMLIGEMIPPHDLVKGGILLPAEIKDISPDFEHLFAKSDYLRVIRVSEQVDSDHYPWLVEIRDRLARGEQGPILEVNPSSGISRYSEDGKTEYKYIGAVNVWCEYDEPAEDGN